MDCRTCQPSLIDLLHGELALEAAEQVRAHIAHCANCKGALDKLSQGLRHAQQLQLSDPPQAVTAHLLQLAEEQARRSAALRKPRGAPTVWQALLDFIGRFAAARQVGMVTIMMLIVAVGLWSLPQLKHTPVAAGGTVVHPDESGEAAPSTGVEPAQPLDLKVDLRAGRIRSRDDVAMAAAPPAPEAPTAAEPEPEPVVVAERAPRPQRSAAPVDKDQSLTLQSARAGGGLADGALRSARRQASASEPAKPARAAPASAAPAPAPFPRNEAYKRAGPGVGASQDFAESEETSASAEAPPAKKGKKSSSEARVGSLEGARVTPATRNCDAPALAEYDRVVRATPGTAAAGEALLQLARCAQARGDAQRARTLLTRAAQIPQVARKATDMLVQTPESGATKAKGDTAAEGKSVPLSDMEK